MSFDALPPEILERIFQKLSYADLLSCLVVSRHWRRAAGAASEGRWRRACMRDFPDAYAEARRKSKYKLTWEQLHKSISSWPLIADATMTENQVDVRHQLRGWNPVEKPRHFYIHSNGLISYPQYTDDVEDPDINWHAMSGDCNSVVYFEIDTLREHELKMYDFMFNAYEENEDIIVFRTDDLDLIVIPKVNKKIFTVGKMKQQVWGDYSEFTVVRSSVYYRAENDMIWVAELKETDGEVTVTSRPLALFDKDSIRVELDIQAMAYVNEEQVNVLTIRGRVYALMLKENRFEYLDRVEKKMSNRNQVVRKLAQYGFEWASRPVHKWACGSDIIDGDWVAITHLKRAKVHRQGSVVLLGTIIRSLHIHPNAYKPDGNLRLYNVQPVRKVDLRDYIYIPQRDSSFSKGIVQLDIVETANGHKIVVLVACQIVVLDFKNATTRDYPPDLVPAPEKRARRSV